jgi:hypothetical protein
MPQLLPQKKKDKNKSMPKMKEDYKKNNKKLLKPPKLLDLLRRQEFNKKLKPRLIEFRLRKRPLLKLLH